MGDGNGQLQRPLSLGPGAPSVAVGDFNGDGRLDLAVAFWGGGTPLVPALGGVIVHLGYGDGTFEAGRFLGAREFGPSAVAVGDFNGDGLLDLAAANGASATVSVFINTTRFEVSFQEPRNVAAGDAPFSVVVGDFDGDGLPDLAVADYTPSGTVSVLLANRSCSFPSP